MLMKTMKVVINVNNRFNFQFFDTSLKTYVKQLFCINEFKLNKEVKINKEVNNNE